MKIISREAILIFIIAIAVTCTWAQTPTPTPRPPAATAPQVSSFKLADYGVSIEPDARLIIVMSALDAAGFDPTPAGKEMSAFRGIVRRDQANLDPALRERLRAFYERVKLPAPATAGDQAARYISLAYALGPPPLLESPERSEDLPVGVLEVLDFAPLLREFYKKSGIDERITSYMRAYQAEGDRMREPAGDMVRAVLTYLHTRPLLVTNQRMRVKSPDRKKQKQLFYETRQHDRHFYLAPDLMSAPGTVNFRVIIDNYYAIVPEGTDPTSSELRRGYLQFVIDPLLLKFTAEINAHRDQVRQLIDSRTKDGFDVSPDVFLLVSRSFVAAADARFEESIRLSAVTNIQRQRLSGAADDATRAAIGQEAQAARAAIADETIARLSEDYEKGAVLDFYFADQLRDFQSSGFDIGNFFGDMIASLDPARESKRLAENATSRNRAIAARAAHPRYQLWLVYPSFEAREDAGATRNTALFKGLSEVEKLLQTRNYADAETRLKAMLQEYPGDARLFFTLGQTSSLWARDTTDDDLQGRRLTQALANYRLAVAAASPDSDALLLLRAHEAMGRILAFLEQNDEALKEFEAAIKIGPIDRSIYNNAVEGKRKLSQP